MTTKIQRRGFLAGVAGVFGLGAMARAVPVAAPEQPAQAEPPVLWSDYRSYHLPFEITAKDGRRLMFCVAPDGQVRTSQLSDDGWSAHQTD